MGEVSANVALNARATVSVAEFEHEMTRYRTASEEAVRSLAGYREVAFDPESDERLDVWGIDPGALRPVVVAIHGGYWRALSRHDTAFMAEVLAERGIATVTPDYSLAPAVTVGEIVRQVRAAVVWVYRHGAEYGLDPERIHLVGSSAGGQLAAMAAARGWQHRFGVPEDLVKGVMSISGIYDLRPLVGSFADEWLHLDPEQAAALSPCLAVPGTCPMVLAVAEHDAIGFHTQAREFAEVVRRVAPVEWEVIADRQHFDVFADLADPGSLLSRRLIALVETTTAG